VSTSIPVDDATGGQNSIIFSPPLDPIKKENVVSKKLEANKYFP
jgi:hypothetical protein